jgi:hypothetical protein
VHLKYKLGMSGSFSIYMYEKCAFNLSNHSQKIETISLEKFTETLENERVHRDRILDEHHNTIQGINEELQHQREKSSSTLKLAYLLRLEIAKQKGKFKK